VPRGRPNAPAGRVVLSLNGGPTDSLVVRLGCQLAQAVETELVAVYVVEVDWRHDLDDDLVESREQASRVLDLAEGMAERARVPMRSQLLQARDVGAAVVERSVLSPRDLEDAYGFPEGQVYHVELALDQAFWMRPLPGWARYRTPISGLYLCGAGTHPGGGVSGIPGHNAAREIIRDFRRGRT